VIGCAPGKQHVLQAFGHQHLGLALAGITGRIIADLAEERQPNLDITGYAPDRRHLR
tara:strand:+ start:16660 stop:16830 length:171 start_codon:yes stop_codon:yes gene_type:complete